MNSNPNNQTPEEIAANRKSFKLIMGCVFGLPALLLLGLLLLGALFGN